MPKYVLKGSASANFIKIVKQTLDTMKISSPTELANLRGGAENKSSLNSWWSNQYITLT